MHNKATLSEKENQRLSALRKLKILDSPFETVFDTIAKVASDICGTPIALISLIDEDRQWFKANVGLQKVTETPREMAFCAHTIMTYHVMEVTDATLDERFVDNPLVTGNPDIRYYAGAPITLPLGENIGTLCVIDRKPGELNEYQKKALEGLAKIVSQILVARDVVVKSNTEQNTS